MTSPHESSERHFFAHLGWLRASVLGANDGVLSNGSLIMGLAAASANRQAILLSAAAGLVAGAMSMAAGEYVSVSSQSDAEEADLARERRELNLNRDAELQELAGIYEARGVEHELSLEVARQLMAKDALAAHARDELGLSEMVAARPIQAALASAASFGMGAALPLLLVLFCPVSDLTWTAPPLLLVILGALGAVGARISGSSILRPVIRTMFWGAIAMATTSGLGALMGAPAP